MKKAKYIVIVDGGIEVGIIFDEILSHKRIAGNNELILLVLLKYL